MPRTSVKSAARPSVGRLLSGNASTATRLRNGPVAGIGPQDVAAPARVRGAHEDAKDPGSTFTDDLDLTVPGAPIDHPARVYPASDDFPTGPAVGERLPGFRLPNQHGAPIDFHASRAGRKAVVAFIRSAVWCYQACSDIMCYRPERVRLSVSVPAGDLLYPSPAP